MNGGDGNDYLDGEEDADLSGRRARVEAREEGGSDQLVADPDAEDAAAGLATRLRETLEEAARGVDVLEALPRHPR